MIIPEATKHFYSRVEVLLLTMLSADPWKTHQDAIFMYLTFCVYANVWRHTCVNIQFYDREIIRVNRSESEWCCRRNATLFWRIKNAFAIKEQQQWISDSTLEEKCHICGVANWLWHDHSSFFLPILYVSPPNWGFVCEYNKGWFCSTNVKWVTSLRGKLSCGPFFLLAPMGGGYQKGINRDRRSDYKKRWEGVSMNCCKGKGLCTCINFSE